VKRLFNVCCLACTGFSIFINRVSCITFKSLLFYILEQRLRLNQMYTLGLLYHSNTVAVLFAYLSSDWATEIGKLLGPKMENSIKCLSEGHSDALPHRESKQGFATFRLLAITIRTVD